MLNCNVGSRTLFGTQHGGLLTNLQGNYVDAYCFLFGHGCYHHSLGLFHNTVVDVINIKQLLGTKCKLDPSNFSVIIVASYHCTTLQSGPPVGSRGSLTPAV